MLTKNRLGIMNIQSENIPLQPPIEFAGALTVASRYDKQQLLPATSSKFCKLFASTVPIYPSSNFSICNDTAEKRLIGRVKMT